jgi:hypothetical protein
MVKFADREFYHLRNTGGLSDVDRNRDGFSTRISDCARGDLCACEIHVRYGDIGSLARKSEAGSAADSARTAGYDRAFTIESHVQYLQKSAALDTFLFGQQLQRG